MGGLQCQEEYYGNNKFIFDRSVSFMKRILVTGGAGFLGSHLCDRLLADGNDVICLDNLFIGSKDNIRHILSNPNFEFIRHDQCR